MAKTNQVIENKTFGDKCQFLVTSEDSKGELLKFKFWCKPGGEGPPLHYHPAQSESFEVVSGELSVTCDGEKRILKKEEKILPVSLNGCTSVKPTVEMVMMVI